MSNFRSLDDLFAPYAHLPNSTPCKRCLGTGRAETLAGMIEGNRRWITGEPVGEVEKEPCPDCNGTGARHCDYGCGRMMVAYSIEFGSAVCHVCATLGNAPRPCSECTWSEPDEVQL